MKKLIAHNLKNEEKLLWNFSRHGGNFTNSELHHYIARRVQQIKQRAKRNNRPDRLEQKLESFKNNGKWAQHMLVELSQKVYEDKNATNNELGKWVSVELECIMRRREDENEFLTFLRKNKWTNFVTIKDDGSIHPDRSKNCNCPASTAMDDEGDPIPCCDRSRHEYGREIVLTFKYGEWDMVKGVCAKLKELEATVNKTCGLHVHFDCRHKTQRSVTTMGKRIARCIPALKQILPPSRQDNRFCEVDINNASSRGRNSRYAFVNVQAYQRHKTLEVRGHSGTLNPVKIINWIKILHVIMNKPRMIQQINTVSEMINTFEFENDTVSYIAKRFEKFAKGENTANQDDVLIDERNEVNFEPVMARNETQNLISSITEEMNRRNEEQRQRASELVEQMQNQSLYRLQPIFDDGSQTHTITLNVDSGQMRYTPVIAGDNMDMNSVSSHENEENEENETNNQETDIAS